MKANEAKSKFVYPDKLYARTNDNITLDISYAPQTMEAVEYVRTDAFIEKAAQWVKENLLNHTYVYEGEVGIGMAVFLEQFKKYMEGE